MALRQPFNVELLAYRKDGGRFSGWSSTAILCITRTATFEGFMVMTSDVAERKRIDEVKTVPFDRQP